MVEGQVGAEKT